MMNPKQYCDTERKSSPQVNKVKDINMNKNHPGLCVKLNKEDKDRQRRQKEQDDFIKFIESGQDDSV